MRAQWGGVRSGWTMVELLIVLAIVAILAVIVYPSYTEHVRRGHRAAAQTALLAAASGLLRSHAGSDGRAGVASPLILPESARQVPAAGGPPSYRVTVDGSLAYFELSATPMGVMSQDVCGVLVLNSLGVQSMRGAAPGADERKCWR